MTIENMLSRLQKVKSHGRGRWLCSCPSHEDKSPSMHIKLEDDGRILINCKAGCDTYSILQSIGLDWGDVMPEKAFGHRIKPLKQVLYASEALELIRYEARIVLASAFKMRREGLASDELDRLDKSMQIINKVTQEAGL